MILTTSNLSDVLDIAFLDRTDLKIYIGVPSVDAIFHIYRTCMIELMKVGIIKPKLTLVDLKCLRIMHFQEQLSTTHSIRLYDISKISEGFSGRTLRKIPFLAHALYLKKNVCTMDEYLKALESTIWLKHKEEKTSSKKECL
ncbi:unnamed protein product [Gordionus sp. m RMFG-2023]